MAVCGDHLVPILLNTTDFSKYDIVFENKLVALYKVTYKELVPGSHTHGTGWDDDAYFHGTGHCGCLATRIKNADNNKISSHAWCGNQNCATQGILNHGNLLSKCPSGGHYFSSCLQVPKQFAINRSSGHDLLSIFVCKARNVVRATSGEAIHYVQRDADILPYYLAIVRR